MIKLSILLVVGIFLGNVLEGNENSPSTPPSIWVENVHGTCGINTPPHDPCSTLMFNAEFLWWKAKEDGLEYVFHYKNRTTTPLDRDDDPVGLDFDWHAGYRVGASWLMGIHDHWDLFANYTHMINRARDSISVAPTSTTESLSVFWFPQILGPAATFAKAKWKLGYDTLDLGIGRDFFLSSTLSLHPHIGLRGALILQNYNVDYLGRIVISNPGPATPATFTPNNSFQSGNDFRGGGLRSGLDSLWHFTKNLGIFGGLSASLLYGKFHIKEEFNGASVTFSGAAPAPVNAATTPRREHSTAKFWRIRPNLELNIGIEWEAFLQKWGQRIFFRAGYELVYWYQQNLLREFTEVITRTGAASFFISDSITSVSKNGDLGFQGFFFSGGYSF